MKLSTTSFRGMAPRLTPRALPDNASQQAINSRLLTGDLEAWKRPLLVQELANAGVVSSIFPLEDIWLSYDAQVEFARGATLDDDEPPRVYITGLDAPRFTTYDLAVASPGTPPYPIDTRLLGVPAPDGAPAVTVEVPDPVESNITLTNPGAEAGNTSGWTITTGGMVALENGDVPGLNAQTGTWFFGGGAVAESVAYQAIDLDALGVIAGQGLSLTWYQARGGNSSTAGMELEFYNAAAALLSTVAAEQVAATALNTWEQRTLETQVPDGAVTARLVQRFTRVGGGDNDAYIDTIAISSIDYTNSFDGSSLSGWQVSPNEGGTGSNSFRRVEIDPAVGWPAPSFLMRGDSRVPYFYRDFSTDRSPRVVLQFDYLELLSRTNCGLHVLLFGSDGGSGTGVFFSAWGGVRLFTHSGWSTLGASVETLSGSLPANTRYTVTLTAEQTSETSATVTVRVINAATSAVLVDDETATISVDGPNIGFKASVNLDDRRYWVDNVSVTVAAPDPLQNDTTTYTSYVYTYVNEFGEESAPSDPSDTVQRNENATTTVITPTGTPTGVDPDYGVTYKRIYRAVTGALGSEFRFVAEIPLDQGEYEDSLLDSELGEVLESDDWDLPPDDLRYILALPNGIMVGASANRLCFSVQNRPHAWPIAYRLATDSDITGLGNVDTTIVVGTQTFVYTASGNTPDAYSMSKPVAPHSCQSARSLAYLRGIGVVFAGPDGLMAVSGPTEVTNLTETIFTREQWQALDPTTILGISHDDIYFFFWGPDNGDEDVFLDTFQGAEGESIVDHTPDVAPEGFAYNLLTGAIDLTGDGQIEATGGADGQAGTDTSSPPIALTLNYPFSASLTGTQIGVESSETVTFDIALNSGPTDMVRIAIGWLPDGGYGVYITDGDNQIVKFVATEDIGEHTATCVFDGEQCFLTVDGEPEQPFQLAGPTSIGYIRLVVSATGSASTLARRIAVTQMNVVPEEPRGGYALQMTPNGFGLIELGMHASAVCVDLVNDALQLVLDAYEEPDGDLLPPDTAATLDTDGRTIYEWNAGATLMRQSWRGKLWFNRHPKTWPWVRVRAESYDDLEIQFYADGALLHQQLVTSNEAFRLPERASANTLDYIVIGTDRVYTVEVADDVMELD
jgi:hypothetical protein